MLAATAAAALLLAGCAPSAPAGRPHPAGTDATPHPTPAAPSSGGDDAAPPSPSARHLTLLPPGCAPGRLRLGRPVHDGAGGEAYTVFPLRLAHGRACTLWGTPAVRLTTRAGAPAPVRYSRRWPLPQHVRPVEVSRRTPQWFALGVFRCDLAPGRTSRRLVARLPHDAGTVTAAAAVGYCGPPDATTVVHVGAIGGWLVGRQRPRSRVVLSVHSSFSPRGRPTWGRGDLDDDGHADLVVVRPPGTVSIGLASGTQRVHLPPSTTARLQGFTDLTGDGRQDVLVASTALGCAYGYRFCASGATVLTVTGGQVRVVRFPDDRPQWNDGRGDSFQGWVCGRGGPTELDLFLTGASSYVLTRTRYRVTGLRARRVSATTVHGSAPYDELARLTRTRCGGLDASGWAAERPPLR